MLSGKLLTGVPVAEKYDKTVVGTVAKAVTTPAFVVAAPAAVATAVVAGPAIAAGVSSAAKAVSSGVKTAVSKVTGSQTVKTVASQVAVQKLTKKETAPNPPVLNQNSGNTGPVGTVIPVGAPGGSAPVNPILTGNEIAGAPNVFMSAPTSEVSGLLPSSALPTASSTTSGIVSVTSSPSKVTKRKSSSKKSKKKSKSKKRSSKRASRSRSKRSRAGSHARSGRSSKQIHYTKNDQPYVIMANGRARFIKKKSGLNRRKRSGGYY